MVIDYKLVALTPAGARTGGQPSDARLTDYYISALARTPFLIEANLAGLIARNDAKLLESERLLLDSGQEAALRFSGPAAMVWMGPAEAGLKVCVRPVVGADGYLDVHVRLRVNLRVPGWDERSCDELVRIKAGDTIILSGLITPREVEIARRATTSGG